MIYAIIAEFNLSIVDSEQLREFTAKNHAERIECLCVFYQIVVLVIKLDLNKVSLVSSDQQHMTSYCSTVIFATGTRGRS